MSYQTSLSNNQRELVRLDELKDSLELALELGELLGFNVRVKATLRDVNNRIDLLNQIENEGTYSRYCA